MTRLAIVAGIVLALAVGPLPAYPQETETASDEAMIQHAERMGDLSALWESIKANADERPRARAAPVPETPELLPALWESIKANAYEGPRARAAPVPETPELLPGLWKHIKANADELK